MKGSVLLALIALTSVALPSAEPPAVGVQMAREQREMAQALRSLPSAEVAAVEQELGKFKIDQSSLDSNNAIEPLLGQSYVVKGVSDER